MIAIVVEKYANPGTCDFEKGHGMCGYRKVVEKGNFNWTFGSRNIGYRRWPKTDHTTANLTGEGMVIVKTMYDPLICFQRTVSLDITQHMCMWLNVITQS